MGNYTIFMMFENPRRGRQARNFTTNVPKILDLKSSSEQIFSAWDWKAVSMFITNGERSGIRSEKNCLLNPVQLLSQPARLQITTHGAILQRKTRGLSLAVYRQIWVVTRDQYGISALVPQTFRILCLIWSTTPFSRRVRFRLSY